MAKKGDHRGSGALLHGRTADADIDLLAVEVLGFLAADTERLHRFLGLTGLDPGGLRDAAAAPGFAKAVLAYLCDDEALLVDFAQETGRVPDAIGRLVRAAAERDAWHHD